jgi:hypothetical protein
MAYIGWAGELLQEEDFAYFLLAFSRFHSMGEFKRKTLNHCPLLLSSWFRERERGFNVSYQRYKSIQEEALFL